jgi:hypothetical protein
MGDAVLRVEGVAAGPAVHGLRSGTLAAHGMFDLALVQPAAQRARSADSATRVVIAAPQFPGAAAAAIRRPTVTQRAPARNGEPSWNASPYQTLSLHSSLGNCLPYGGALTSDALN